jgi:carboxypeptidase Q
MIQSALGASPLEENLRYLTDSIGGRVTGSPEADRAVGWAVEALRHAGVDEVHTEKFTLPAGWSEGHTHAEVLAPAAFSLHLVSTGWSPPISEGGITADVADAGDGDDAGFAKLGAAANGAIVLIHTKTLATWKDLSDEYLIDPAIVERARKAGAAAIFWMSTRPNLLLYRHTTANGGQIDSMPQAILAREDAERIARFLVSKQEVRVHLEMPNRVSGPVESENVVAEIRGRENPDEFVLLGAHLDSWELGTGALDNGCNVAMVIDAARVIHASGSIPRRSIRFVLFTGEEQYMLGSWAYARAHREDLDKMAAAVVYDSGAGAVTGYSLGGRNDTLAAVREILEPVRSLGVKEFTLDADAGTDNFDFLLEGVPTLVANQDAANYLLNYHAASDTFDKVDIAQLKRNTAVAAVTVYALADAAQRIGHRQSRAEIDQLLKDTGLDREMKLEGFWPAWENGERGRQP